MNIFFDFDGTLNDASKRLYILFASLVPESKFTISEYWDLKRAGKTHFSILTEYFNYNQSEIEEFEILWMKRIEDKQSLAHDILYPDAINFLREISQTSNLYLVTARQSPQNLFAQLSEYGLETFFKKVLVTEQVKTKLEMIRENAFLNSNDFLISDTCEDIQTGKKLGIKTIAVEYGFRNKIALEKCNPDFFVDEIKKIEKIISIN